MIGKGQIREGGCEETFLCLSLNWVALRFTVPPAVALLNYISSGILWRIFSQTGIFAGFLYISLISQDTPPYCDFLRFFLFIIRRKDQRSCDVRGRGRGKLYFTAPVVNGLELYCSTCIHRVPKCMPRRRNWFPPPPPKVSLSPPLDPKGGGGTTLSCRWGGGGTQFGRLDRRLGTLYTLWPRW